MTKIKVLGGLIFTLSIVLAFLSNFIANESAVQSRSLSFINEQKAFTQEISKSIFYTYRNRDNSSTTLDNSIKSYLNNTKVNESELTQNHLIAKLWNIFYTDVQKFRIQQRVTTGYNAVITARLVNRIYHNNVLLVKEFDKTLELKQAKYDKDIEIYKLLQYTLFFILIGLLIYLFTQVHLVILFIQKFSKTSKDIIENSTIQGLKPIKEIEQGELKEVTKNYNHLIEKINNSIDYSTKSMEQSRKSLEEVERNIEDFMELLSTMQEEKSEALFEKEDVVIDSLDTIMKLKGKLGSLKNDLDNLLKV